MPGARAPSDIKNKIKRNEIRAKERHEKKQSLRDRRKKRKREIEELGDQAPPPKLPVSIDEKREFDATVVTPGDEEVQRDEAIDEFSKFFSGEARPKILITTSPHATKVAYDFIRDLLHLIPNSFFYARKKFRIKRIVDAAIEKGFTYVMIVHQDHKELNSIVLSHLPNGPTALFTLKNVVLARDVPNRGRSTKHKPEIILNNFNTRLGHRVGRMLGSLFHQEPNFRGRRVVTFHNQRDFIFVRHHRYEFDGPKKARLQELGPQFTLKLKSLQHGTFDPIHGEYEWIHTTEMDTSRKRFFL